MKTKSDSSCELPCSYCGHVAGVVFVHGHYQCNHCKQNVVPCCNGEQESDELLSKRVNALKDLKSVIREIDNEELRSPVKKK